MGVIGMLLPCSLSPPGGGSEFIQSVYNTSLDVTTSHTIAIFITEVVMIMY